MTRKYAADIRKSPQIKTPALALSGVAEAGQGLEHARAVAGRQPYCDLLTTRTNEPISRSEMAVAGSLQRDWLAFGIDEAHTRANLDPTNPGDRDAEAG